MSLTSFLDIKEVRANCARIRPKFPRKVPVEIRVPPLTGNYATIGAAFDYLMRFEIQRRSPWAVGKHWVAEAAQFKMQLYTDFERKVLGLKVGGNPDDPNETLAQCVSYAAKTVAAARSELGEYCTLMSPNAQQIERMAVHSVRLARLDAIWRLRVVDLGASIFETPADGDVQEIVAMLAIVPFEKITDCKPIILNPGFGESSLLVGGADSDVIAGQSLWDFKTVRKGSLESPLLDQLLGYFLLAKKERERDKTFPRLDQCCIYFARHGHLWSIKTTDWTDHPEFEAVESWFFERAAEREALHAELKGQVKETDLASTNSQSEPSFEDELRRIL